ncbi:MAG: hypothetical protein LUD77_07380 [Clostridiales bacterium]|nr:hypothetical protein [Clostridiales bacterium]
MFVNKAFIKSGTMGQATSYSTTSNASYGVITRSISGTVFIDYDKDGIYNNNDAALSGVTAYVYKSTGSGYEQVTTNLTGTRYVDGVTTGSDGTYSFIDLPDGSYVVGFASDSVNLSGYELTTWHVDSGITSATDSDAVAISSLTDSYAQDALSGYTYAIQADDNQSYVTLGTDFNTLKLVEGSYNLGLNSGYALPEAGGNGVNSFRYWGLAFLSVGALLLPLKKRPLR